MKVISTELKPIKLWLDDIEDGALQQAKNLANLPFTFRHIAIMPDSHQGYGMPIGGIVALEGAVSPNMVGVDIGCFSGDTKIPLLNGLQKTLKELTDDGKDIYVYSLDERLKLTVGKATPKLTRKNAELLEITISGGETIRCTPDHRFMLIDGTYRQAKNLQTFNSLMPLYRSYESKDGYEHIKTTQGTGIPTHKMVTSQFLGEKKGTDIRHHKDENWYNNDPINLEYKDAKLHSKEHRLNNPIFGTEDFKNKRLDKLREKGFYAPEFAYKKKQVAVKNIGEHNKSDKKEEQDKLAGKRGAKYLVEYNKSEKGRLQSSVNGKKNLGRRFNHKVLFIKKINKKEDVYCLTVEKYHNFALSVGVFVHNCGMCAVKTSLTEITTDTLKELMGEIRKAVPVGFAHQQKKQDETLMPQLESTDIVKREYQNALGQIGTLGGGNHFIEIQKGNDGNVWIMVHSGSRNFGFKTAHYYNEKAVELNERWRTVIPKDQELAFLPLGEQIAEDYLKDMTYSVEFALANRKLMMENIKKIFEEKMKCTFESMINIPHNYAVMENHFGKNVLVHRKGATKATVDTVGIIPGSQGTSSYIVKGKGNPESFQSCSHGAGRKMGRKQAQRTLNLDEEKKKLDDLGIIHSVRSISDLDEAPGSYKSIDDVMRNQADLVDIMVELKPLAVIKG